MPHTWFSAALEACFGRVHAARSDPQHCAPGRGPTAAPTAAPTAERSEIVMHVTRSNHTASSSLSSSSSFGDAARAALAGLLAVALLALGGVAPAGAEIGAEVDAEVDAEGTSDAGVAPRHVDTGPGGNVACDEIDGFTGMTSSSRVNYGAGGFDGSWPDGIEVVVTDGTSVAWTSTFTITAVIVKGGPAANVYVYVPALGADSGLVPPTAPSGQPAGLSNLTFCWDPDTEAEVGSFCDSLPDTIVVGPVLIRSGALEEETVPDPIVELEIGEEEMLFESTMLVAGVVVIASPEELHEFETPVLKASLPVVIGEDDDLDLVFCVLTASTVPTDPPAPDPVPAADPAPPTPQVTQSADPTVIPTGGGPAERTSLSLLAFVILSLVGSTAMTVWSRGA